MLLKAIKPSIDLEGSHNEMVVLCNFAHGLVLSSGVTKRAKQKCFEKDVLEIDGVLYQPWLETKQCE